MQENYKDVLEAKLTEENHEKLMALKNPKLHRFVAESIELCWPDTVFVCTDAPEDIQYIRQKTILLGKKRNYKKKGIRFISTDITTRPGTRPIQNTSFRKAVTWGRV